MSSAVSPPDPYLGAPNEFTTAEERGWPGWWVWLSVGLVLAVAAGYGGWKAGLRPGQWFGPRQGAALATLTIDEGELYAVVTENGTLESADNASVRCQVEALLGVTGGSTGTTGGMSKSATSGGSAGGSMGGSAGASAGASSGAATKSTGKAASKSRATGGTSKSAGSSAGGSSSSGSASASGGGTSGASGGSGSAAGGGTTTSIAVKPTIQSFSMQVAAYSPLRPATSKSASSSTGRQSRSQSSMGGGGGGGRGGGGPGGMQERPGSTRIIRIAPQGTRVKAGDVVCELDSAEFVTELQAQKIRYLQAESWVEQARSILEVNLISQKEYEQGIYPQDTQLIRQYLTSCQIEEERARKNYLWSKETGAKGYRTPSQVEADALSLQQAQFRLTEAQGMANRLEQYTAPRLLKSLGAKIEANKADQLAQESSFQLESDRLRRLEKAVANCTLRAPRDGIVVYYNPPNRWGRVEDQITEGMTVHEGQTLIELPDPTRMRVRARVNESKVSLVRPGMRALITVDAFPERPLAGKVGEVTPIPAGADGPVSDVKIYYATVSIDAGGFEGLRPGLSAEVAFLVEAHQKVTRVPLQAVRWVDSQAFVAVTSATTRAGDRQKWTWRNVQLGQSDTAYFQVVSGLKPGDRVVADPAQLPAPRLQRPEGQTRTVAEAASERPRS